MVSAQAFSLLRLTRADGSLLAFLLFFVPCYVHVRDASRSIALASPIFLIVASTFILNNINDIERDRVNHPTRPLPSGLISLRFASLLYGVLFVAALATTYLFIPTEAQYYLLFYFLLTNNYNTMVNNFVGMKNPYAALCHAIPILIVSEVCGSGAVPYLLTPSVFLFSLGREIMMDLRDLDGDGPTLVKLVSPKIAQIIAFTFQSLGVILLGLCADTVLRQTAFCVVGTMHVLLVVRAARGTPHATLVRLMKIQFAVGIAFLL